MVTLDHRLLYCNTHSNNHKAWNIARITKMWHRETKWANAVGKMVPTDLIKAATNLQFVKNAVSLKHNTFKHNKMRPAYTQIPKRKKIEEEFISKYSVIKTRNHFRYFQTERDLIQEFWWGEGWESKKAESGVTRRSQIGRMFQAVKCWMLKLFITGCSKNSSFSGVCATR